jgi:hypothetical protein
MCNVQRGRRAVLVVGKPATVYTGPSASKYVHLLQNCY